jgi:hypothetical protein
MQHSPKSTKTAEFNQTFSVTHACMHTLPQILISVHTILGKTEKYKMCVSYIPDPITQNKNFS